MDSVQSTFSNNSTLFAVAAGIIMGVTLYGSFGHFPSKPPKLRQRKPRIPPWARDNPAVQELPPMTPEQIESLNLRKPPERWNTVIFFPDLSDPPLPDGPTMQLVQLFKEARFSIQVCMYVCSNSILSDAIKDMYNEGLFVQVITEYDTWTAHNNFGFRALEKAGIEVRLSANGYLMHNKFAIIDEDAVITGSLNWTRQGLSSNNENVMVTTNRSIVRRYLEEYNNILRTCMRSTEVKVVEQDGQSPMTDRMENSVTPPPKVDNITRDTTTNDGEIEIEANVLDAKNLNISSKKDIDDKKIDADLKADNDSDCGT